MCQTLFSGAKVQKIHAAETFVNKKIQNVYHRDYEYTKIIRQPDANTPDCRIHIIPNLLSFILPERIRSSLQYSDLWEKGGS